MPARSKWKPSAARPGPKAMATPLPVSGRADQLGEHEHQGRGRHVAVAGEHVARGEQRALRQLQPLLDRVEDRAAAGMDRPAVDLRPGPSHCRASRAPPRPRSACWIRPGTSPDRVISKPVSPIFHWISSAESSSCAEKRWLISSPPGSAVTRAAAAPSLNWSMASSGSSCCVSWRWSEQSSTVTASTRASGSERTIW